MRAKGGIVIYGRAVTVRLGLGVITSKRALRRFQVQLVFDREGAKSWLVLML
jgi:hypothetical protein